LPIYHFNVRDGIALPDLEGHELPDLAAARRMAVVYAGSLIRELGDQFWDGHEWILEVTSPEGLVFFELVFFANHAPASNWPLSGHPA